MQYPRFVLNLRNRINSMSGLGLAWLSLIAAIIGGSAASICWIGGLIQGGASMLPWHLGWAAPLVVSVVFLVDVFSDLTPNRKAVFAASVLPSLFLLVHGTLGGAVHGWIDHINTWSHQNFGTVLGEGSATAVATLCLLGAFMLAQRAAPKLEQGSRGMADAGAGRRM